MTAFRISCLLAISWTGFLITGCSGKAVQSGGETSRSPVTTERLPDTGPVVRADSIKARQQLDDIRAEETATAATGLRDVFFAYDSWSIGEEGRQVLTQDAAWLRTNERVRVRVEGHCDERGSDTYNLVLAEKRAKSVRNYLVELGVRGDRVTIVSYGEERPFCRDRSESCYQLNRRGHLVVKP